MLRRLFDREFRGHFFPRSHVAAGLCCSDCLLVCCRMETRGLSRTHETRPLAILPFSLYLPPPFGITVSRWRRRRREICVHRSPVALTDMNMQERKNYPEPILSNFVSLSLLCDLLAFWQCLTIAKNEGVARSNRFTSLLFASLSTI